MEIRHVYGNPLKLSIPLQKVVYELVDGHQTKRISDFYPNPNYPVSVILRGVGSIRYDFIAKIEGNVAIIEAESNIRIGTYSIEVLAHDENEEQVRYKVKGVINVVDATKDAGIEAGVEFDAQTHTIDGAVFFYAKGDKGDRGDDGVGIASVEQIETSEKSSGTNVVRVTLTNGVTSDFEIRNGAQASISVVGETLIFN